MSTQDARLIVTQDPDAHLFYEVDWTDWLAKRNFLAADIVSVVWTVPSPLVKTHELITGAISRVWIKNVPKGNIEHEISARINMPEPTGGAGAVTDDFTFKIKGRHK